MVRTRSYTAKKLDKWTSFKDVKIYPITQTWVNAKNEAFEKLKVNKGDTYHKLCIEIYNRMYREMTEK